MRAALVGALVLVAVALAWFWIGQPRALPPSPLAAEARVACVSYAPFEGEQSPFIPGIVIPPEQIDRQLAALARVTDCVRTYSTSEGLDQVAPLARKHGLTVLQGVWIGREAAANEREIEQAIAIAKAEPETVRAVIVGNEVLLRGEQRPEALAAYIARVRAAVPMPVTYADVWEFWEKYPEIAEAVDFVTIHILPYWEDHPVPIELAAAHIGAIRLHMEQALPGKDLLIGETGWPSAGRQREGAVPSPVNQARFFHELLALLAERGWDYNLIEAFDQDWKRALEGTVGGHWGFLDAEAQTKFAWGQPLSDHPHWTWQAAGGLLLALLVMAAGARARGWTLAKVALIALTAGLALPWWAEQALASSLDSADWVRAVLALALGLALAPLTVLALVRNERRPVLAALLGGAPGARGLARLLGLGLLASLLLALPWALGLAVDPRYRDFFNAALAVPAVCFLLLRPAAGPRLAESACAAVLALAALYSLANEGLENHQSLLWSALVLLLAAGLRPRVAAPAPAGPA